MTQATAHDVCPEDVGRRLAGWFARHARDLPWRRRRTPYTTFVVEFMLQQTQVARVVERLEGFLARFPSIEVLAAASEDDVLDAWQGLGYYRRARHLHAAARRIVRDLDGRVPSDVETLETLPGIGRYTAGAIVSQAYGVRAPVVDGNVQRVLARLHARPGPVTSPALRDEDWAWATQLVERASAPAGVINEAIMELGATVCTPRRPDCAACPLAEICLARANGDPTRYPGPKPRVARALVHHHAVVIRRGSRLLLERRPDTGLWARLWQTPTVETAEGLDVASVVDRLSVPVVSIEPIGLFEHTTTHRNVRFAVFRARTRTRRGSWCEEDALPAMSNAHKRVLAMAASR